MESDKNQNAARSLAITIASAILSMVMPAIAFGENNITPSDSEAGDILPVVSTQHSSVVVPANAQSDSAVPLAYESTRMTPDRLRQLMRPNFGFGAEWIAESEGVGLSSFDARITVPTYPIFGPPPPLVSAKFELTDVVAPADSDLPETLYQSSIGLSWIRKRNERWMFRWMLGIANATDGNNHSSDAWQFRGGGFAVYRPNPCWTWTFGAIALGREDIPVVPAIGVIYQPNPGARLDLNFPRPRLSVLMADHGERQHWAYLGAGLDGGTWGYERAGGEDDQITYRDWRFVFGWESTPRLQPGMPFALGRKFGVEMGYALGRKFEFESERPDLSLGDSFIVRATASF